MNEKTINIKKLINNYTIETTPKVYEKIGNLKDLLMFTKLTKNQDFFNSQHSSWLVVG